MHIFLIFQPVYYVTQFRFRERSTAALISKIAITAVLQRNIITKGWYNFAFLFPT